MFLRRYVIFFILNLSLFVPGNLHASAFRAYSADHVIDELSQRRNDTAAAEAVHILNEKRLTPHHRKNRFISLLLKLHLCPIALWYGDIDREKKEDRPFLWARFYEEGLCVEKDLKKAKSLYRQAIKTGQPYRDKAYARLAHMALFQDADPEKARELFQLALIHLDQYDLQEIFMGEPVSKLDFAHFLNPIWDAQAPFGDMMDWLKTFVQKDTQTLVDFALSQCHLDMPECSYVTYNWLWAIAHFRNSPKASYHLAKLQLIPENKREISHPFDIYTWSARILHNLEYAAFFDHVPAIKELIAFLQRNGTSRQARYAIYFWHLKLQELGASFNHNDLKTARNAIPEQPRAEIEKMFDSSQNQQWPAYDKFDLLPPALRYVKAPK